MHDLEPEFSRQIQNLVDKGYPKLLGIKEKGFLNQLKPLSKELGKHQLSNMDIENGIIPFVIVVNSERVNGEEAMELTQKDGKSGVSKLSPLTSRDFQTINGVQLPGTSFYLLINVDRGKDNINKPPAKALTEILAKGNSPLTVNEGIALIIHYPDFLMKNNCFSLLASRHFKPKSNSPADKRVPAIWINSEKKPNLGWCWDGNPHTWLGSASCETRIGIR